MDTVAQGAGRRDDVEAEMALLRRRLARSEAARAQAEALLEEKSRVLAQANEDLVKAKDLLRIELGQKTRQLLDAQRVAGFGTMVWNADNFRGELSQHCQTLLGLPGVAVIETLNPILDRVIGEDRDRMRDWANTLVSRALEIKRAEDSNALAANERMLEMRVAGNSPGEPDRLIRILAETVRDEALDHMMLFLTLQDITREVAAANEAEALRRKDQERLHELEELTAELRRAREQADAANAAKTRFLAMMSHDIRTPMNGVLGMLTLFDEAGLSPAQMDTLRVVRESSNHLRILLDDIIDLERAQSGKLALNPAPMNAEVFLKGVLGFWAKAAQDKGLTFTLERLAFGWPQRSPDWVMIDRLRLRQVADNLLSNALKHTRKGGITVRTGLVAADRLRFEIIDSGPGIPHERRAELFEDFAQIVAKGMQAGGAGLGLAICKRLVTQMGGAIGIETGPGGIGTSFWVELPWQAAQPAVEAQPDAPMTLRHPDGRRPLILVAEDVATNRIVAKGLLERLGCDVELVENGREAVEAAASGRFDLVLMDVSMPEMDGPTATRLIRELPAPTGDIPVIALTAYSQAEEIAPMLNAGAMGAINKPIVLADLHRALHDVCCSAHDDT